MPRYWVPNSEYFDTFMELKSKNQKIINKIELDISSEINADIDGFLEMLASNEKIMKKNH